MFDDISWMKKMISPKPTNIAANDISNLCVNIHSKTNWSAEDNISTQPEKFSIIIEDTYSIPFCYFICHFVKKLFIAVCLLKMYYANSNVPFLKQKMLLK